MFGMFWSSFLLRFDLITSLIGGHEILINSTTLTFWLQGKHVSVYGSLINVAPDPLHAVPSIYKQAGACQRGKQHTAWAGGGRRATGCQLTPTVCPKVKCPKVVVVFVVSGEEGAKESSENVTFTFDRE